MRLRRWLQLVTIVIGALLAFAWWLSTSRQLSPASSQTVPEFSLPQLREPDQSLSAADLRGQVSLLNVWASWCIACRREHPLLMELAAQEAIHLYGLNYKDQRGDALRWLEFYGDPYIASFSDSDGKIGIKLGVHVVPATFLLDQQGRIRYKHSGPLNRELWEQTLWPLILQLQADGQAQSLPEKSHSSIA